MGVVYTAQDNLVDRFVALRFVPEPLAKDRHFCILPDTFHFPER
jgi:hypothetical protein